MAKFRVDLLDVGAISYGDSILCQIGSRTILIDGGKKASGRKSSSIVLGEQIHHRPLQDQVQDLLETARVDLLVVTHCHSDHVGCLPQLFEDGELECEWALLADPQLGFGITSGSDEPPAFEAMTARDKLEFALREEPLLNATDEEIRAFIEDSAREYQAYVQFVNRLQQRLGARCVLYRGPSEDESPGLDDLLSEFSDAGLKLYGPSQNQLLLCAAFLAGRSEDSIDSALEGSTSLTEAYKAAVARFEGTDAEESGENGNAVNCQSIVLSLAAQERKVLFTGDMQFTRTFLAESVTQEVQALLADVIADGPFDFVKLSHHGATNGQNKAMLKRLGAKLLGISTGTGSSQHPTDTTLRALEELKSEMGIQWVRVDMNGRCTYFGTSNKLAREHGQLNDDTRPGERSGDAGAPAETATGLTAPGPLLPSTTPAVSPAAAGDGGFVEVQIKVPHRKTKVTFSIEIDPPFESSPPAPQAGTTALRLGGGGQTKPGSLLFVTDPQALASRIGGIEPVRSMVRNAGHTLLEGAGAMLVDRVRERLRTDAGIQGVVLLGGYEVVPSQILLTLPPELKNRRIAERDRLQVWSDDFYGDREGDGVPELPVSRIPDGGSSAFLLRCLSARPLGAVAVKSGIRNLVRPFADSVFARLPGKTGIFTCASRQAGQPPYRLEGDVMYLMLHGSADDATRFKGESEDDPFDFPVAMRTSDVPNPCPPVVFTGCCYGALIVDTRASDARPGDRLQSRTPESSIALKCLENGANAFIGCTGVHYSPLKEPLNYFGEPLHRLFWENLVGGHTPSKALWMSKIAYARGIPYKRPASVESVAIEHKILRQYTCLGLGW